MFAMNKTNTWCLIRQYHSIDSSRYDFDNRYSMMYIDTFVQYLSIHIHRKQKQVLLSSLLVFLVAFPPESHGNFTEEEKHTRLKANNGIYLPGCSVRGSADYSTR